MTHSLGIAFGSTSVVRTQWNNNDALAITIQRDPKDKTNYYWRAFAYDQIGLNDWSVGPKSTSIQVPANTSILKGLADDPVEPGHKEITFTVTPEGFHDATMISPATPTTANQGVRVSYVGTDGYFTVLERDGGNGQYQLTASVPVRWQRARRAQRRGAPGDRSRLSAGDPRPVHPDPGRRDRAERPGARGQDQGDRRGPTRSTSPRRSRRSSGRARTTTARTSPTSTAATGRRPSASRRSSRASASGTP